MLISRPHQLDLTAIEELIVTENLNKFSSNGFKIQVNQDSPVGKRCSVTSLPISKNAVFSLKDLEELIHLIRQNPGMNVRPSKVRSILAMRACRSSVMIGKALKFDSMSTIVKNLGTLSEPWSCPHGRPTMSK